MTVVFALLVYFHHNGVPRLKTKYNIDAYRKVKVHPVQALRGVEV